jgi:hypothetical protein
MDDVDAMADDLNLNNINLNDPLATPGASNTPQPSIDPVISVSLRMWTHLLSRLSSLEALLESRCGDHERQLETLDTNFKTLKNRHNTLEDEYFNQAVLSHKRSDHQEPKIPDPPMFSGERKDLLPFLTKCQIKFEGQPSRFPKEKDKILYAGSRLDGPAFSWFQPLIAPNPDGSTKPAPPELASFKVFSDALTLIYGDPNLEATAEREIRRLHQTGSAAEYAAKFESKKQYLKWNDEAFRDQFYLNLKEEIKDEIAPVGKPKTYLEMKTLAIRLDARLFERRLERPTKPPPARPATRPFTWSIPSANPAPAPIPSPASVPKATAPPSGGLRVPSQTADGTVPMELDASGVWHLTETEKSRRRALGLCGYCGEKGHGIYSCPVAPPLQNPRPGRQTRPSPQFNRQVMTFEISQPETGKDDAQE